MLCSGCFCEKKCSPRSGYFSENSYRPRSGYFCGCTYGARNVSCQCELATILLFPLNNVECENAQPGRTEGHLSLTVWEVNTPPNKGSPLPSPPGVRWSAGTEKKIIFGQIGILISARFSLLLSILQRAVVGLRCLKSVVDDRADSFISSARYYYYSEQVAGTIRGITGETMEFSAAGSFRFLPIIIKSNKRSRWSRSNEC